MPFGFQRRESKGYNKKIEKPNKTYIEFICWHGIDARVILKSIRWPNNVVFEIDKVINV